MIETGKAYYVFAHAYHHFLGIVTDITPRHVTLNNCLRIYSCRRSWEDFFRDGMLEDTVAQQFPDGTQVEYRIGICPWAHEAELLKRTKGKK